MIPLNKYALKEFIEENVNKTFSEKKNLALSPQIIVTVKNVKGI
jgi:hypothetical protein